jgi:hypothetical protein
MRPLAGAPIVLSCNNAVGMGTRELLSGLASGDGTALFVEGSGVVEV